tara:strand:+ start:120291 stop:121106 length:816 start_codon:yes stop_codon:yes gene_type:complete
MNPTDTIGLTEFLVLVYNFIKRNFIILSISTIIGFVFGIGYTYQKANYYASEMIGFSNIIEKTTLLEILAPLTTLTEEKNYDALSTKLGISKEEAAQIRNLEFSNSKHTKTSHAPSATDLKLGKLIMIQANVYDQKVLPNLANGIKLYLSQNEFIFNTNKFEYQKTLHLIEEMTTNIAMIDSISRSVLTSKSSVSIINEINPNHYKEAISSLENLKVQAQTLEPFTIVSRFYTVNKPSNKNLVIIIAATVTFFVLGLFMVFIKELALLSKK